MARDSQESHSGLNSARHDSQANRPSPKEASGNKKGDGKPAAFICSVQHEAYGLVGISSSLSDAMTPMTPATTISARIQAQLPPPMLSASPTDEDERTSATGAAAAAVEPRTRPAEESAKSALRIIM